MNHGHLEANETIAEPHEIWAEPHPGPTTYKHQPLDSSSDEIRLLKLRKGNEAPLCCEIQVFPLERAPEYIALSYLWGPPWPLHDILVGHQALKIRDNLHACLLELREDTHTWLWIDQICIAQADTAERNHQVGMMSRIYSASASAIAWLNDVPKAGPGEVDRFNDRDIDHASILVLLKNKYFTRLWIVQEVLLPRSIKFHLNGKRCVRWKTIVSVHGRRLLKLAGPAPLSVPFSGLIIHASQFRGELANLSWEECINYYSSSACVDPRDKVYAMMGIVREEDRLIVDYNKSVFEVFLDVVSRIKRPMGLPRRRLMKKRLYKLGYEMGIKQSLVHDLEHVVHERLKKSFWKAVSPINFKKANHEGEKDYWWYECNGNRFIYSYQPYISPVAPSKHTIGITRRIYKRSQLVIRRMLFGVLITADSWIFSQE